MNAEMSTVIQKEFLRLIHTSQESEDLVGAFKMFFEAFLLLKADNEKDNSQRAADFRAALTEMRAKIATLDHGKDGKTPKAGIDYPSREQFAQIMEAMRPKMPEAGVDFEVPQSEDIVREVLAQIPPADIFKILFEAPDNVILAINEATNSHIQPSQVAGLVEFMEGMKRKSFAPFYVGTGSSSGGGGTATSVSVVTPPESADASTTLFTVTKQPLWMVADGIQYFEGAGYSYSSLQVTMDLAPSQTVRAVVQS